MPSRILLAMSGAALARAVKGISRVRRLATVRAPPNTRRAPNNSAILPPVERAGYVKLQTILTHILLHSCTFLSSEEQNRRKIYN